MGNLSPAQHWNKCDSAHLLDEMLQLTHYCSGRIWTLGSYLLWTPLDAQTLVLWRRLDALVPTAMWNFNLFFHYKCIFNPLRHIIASKQNCHHVPWVLGHPPLYSRLFSCSRQWASFWFIKGSPLSVTYELRIQLPCLGQDGWCVYSQQNRLVWPISGLFT